MVKFKLTKIGLPMSSTMGVIIEFTGCDLHAARNIVDAVQGGTVSEIEVAEGVIENVRQALKDANTEFEEVGVLEKPVPQSPQSGDIDALLKGEPEGEPVKEEEKIKKPTLKILSLVESADEEEVKGVESSETPGISEETKDGLKAVLDKLPQEGQENVQVLIKSVQETIANVAIEMISKEIADAKEKMQGVVADIVEKSFQKEIQGMEQRVSDQLSKPVTAFLEEVKKEVADIPGAVSSAIKSAEETVIKGLDDLVKTNALEAAKQFFGDNAELFKGVQGDPGAPGKNAPRWPWILGLCACLVVSILLLIWMPIMVHSWKPVSIESVNVQLDQAVEAAQKQIDSYAKEKLSRQGVEVEIPAPSATAVQKSTQPAAQPTAATKTSETKPETNNAEFDALMKYVQ